MKTSKQVLNESSFILIASAAFVKIISAIFKIPLASEFALGNVGFGYFSVAHDIFTPFFVLAISGLPAAISHITAEFIANAKYSSIKDSYKTIKKLFSIIGAIAGGIVAIIVLLIFILSKYKFYNFYSILAVTPAIFLSFIMSIYRGFFEGHKNMRPTAISKIIQAIFKSVLSLALAILVIKTTDNYALAAAAATLAISIGSLISTLYLKYKFKNNSPLKDYKCQSESIETTSLKSILILALPFAFASLASSLIALVDAITVNFSITNASQGYIDIVRNLYLPKNLINKANFDITAYLYGIRSKAFTIYDLIPTITMSVGLGALPTLTQSKAVNDDKSVISNTNYVLKLITTLTFPAAIGLIALGGPIMNLLYSSNDTLSANVLMIYGLAALFAGFSVPVTSVLQSLNCQYDALKHVIIGLFIKVVTNLIFIQFAFINVSAAALGTLCCYFYIAVSFIILLFKSTKIDVKNIFIKPLISAIVCGLSAHLVSLISSGKLFTLLSIAVAFVVYLLFILLTKTYTHSELINFPIINRLLPNKSSINT